MSNEDYETVKIPVSSRKEYEKKNPSGYTGYPDFVRDSIRKNLEALN